MKPLTRRLLRNVPCATLAGPDVSKRGWACYNKDQVTDFDLRSDSLAVCQVSGASGDYDVRIQTDSCRLGVAFHCNCQATPAWNREDRIRSTPRAAALPFL